MWDLSLPGYKYLGPGNKLDKGEPTSFNDWVAFVHDLGYGEIINQGGNPYITFSDADELALAQFDWSDYGGVLASGYFSFKKKLYQAGLITKWEPNKQLKEDATTHKQLRMGWLDKKQNEAAAKALYGTKAGQRILEHQKAQKEAAKKYQNKRLRTEDDMGETDMEDMEEEGNMNDITQEATMDASGDVTMGTATPTNMALAAKSSEGGGTNGTGETPVNLNTRWELGIFTETRTVKLPIRFGVGFNSLRHTASANVLKLRMNAPYNILKDTTFVQQTESAATNEGVSTNQPFQYNSGNNGSILDSFETTLIPPTAPTASTAGAGVVSTDNVVPAWRKFYDKIYESYHTIQCNYKITFINNELNMGSRAAIYVDKDVYTTSSAGNILPTDKRNFYYNAIYRGIEKHIVAERNNSTNEPWIKTITGVWKPGTWSKNTLNAEDIKAWYTAGTEPTPAWTENLVIVALTDEYNIFRSNLSCFVELEYIVQYKDLKGDIRYPYATATDIVLTIPDDILQIPNTAYDWGATY